MTAGTIPSTLRAARRVSHLSGARLPVDGVVSGEDLLLGHLGGRDTLEDEGGLRAQRREALLHRLELDRQRQRRRRSA